MFSVNCHYRRNLVRACVPARRPGKTFKNGHGSRVVVVVVSLSLSLSLSSVCLSVCLRLCFRLCLSLAAILAILGSTLFLLAIQISFASLWGLVIPLHSQDGNPATPLKGNRPVHCEHSTRSGFLSRETREISTFDSPESRSGIGRSCCDSRVRIADRLIKDCQRAILGNRVPTVSFEMNHTRCVNARVFQRGGICYPCRTKNGLGEHGSGDEPASRRQKQRDSEQEFSFFWSVKISRTADGYSRPRHTSGTPLESSVSHLGIAAAGPRPHPPPTGLDCLPATPPPPHLLIRFFLRAQWSPNPSRTTLPSSLPGFSFSPPPLPPPFFFFVSRWNSVEE